MRLLLLALLAASALACSSSSTSSAPADAGQTCTSDKPEMTCAPGAADSNSCVGDNPNDSATSDQTVGFALGCRALYKDRNCQVFKACTCSQSPGPSGHSFIGWGCL